MDLYDGLMNFWHGYSASQESTVTVRAFSDSMIVVCDTLAPLIGAVNALQFTALAHDCLLRGGIAHGKHAERESNGQLHVVSVPLILAARLEEQIRAPAVALDPSAMPPMDFTQLRNEWPFARGLLYFRGWWIVNPFNPMWGTSAATRARQLREQSPEHAEKYDWFLDLYEAVASGQPLVPESG